MIFYLLEVNNPKFESFVSQISKFSSVFSSEIGYMHKGMIKNNLMSGCQIIYCLHEEKIIAFCQFRRSKKEDKIILYEIITYPTFRKTGIAKNLIQMIFELTGCDKIFLKCLSDNKSNSFYAKIGGRMIANSFSRKGRKLNEWILCKESLGNR